MEALLGFLAGIWDHRTFLVLAILFAANFALGMLVLGLLGRIAIARKHSEAEASN
jgi:hypothetical protein